MRSTSMVLVLALCAGACAESARAARPADAFPAGVSVYASREGAARVAGIASDEPAHYFQGDPAVTPASEKQSYWPVLYSTLMPGVGEFTMGYKGRGIALMAIEIAAWTGYFVKHEDGMQGRDEYEAFADLYWTQRKFIDDHPLVYPQTGWTQEQLEQEGQAVSGSGGEWWTGYVPWVSKEEDKQHYYENIGKYDWFVSGWSDYDPTLTPPVPVSELREEYVEMRNQSNDDLDDANKFVWVSLAARVFSIAETAIIVRNRREKGEQASGGFELPVAVRARPRGFDGGELALEVRFR
ncbi:MAG: hypothetical protein L0Z51_10790 [Candidatus Latescibacteria bacterium]|nr:hypothetical protein [Candidatus Latescibacterota bacterium]